MKEGKISQALTRYEEALAAAPQSKDICLEYVVALRKGNRLQQSAKVGWRLLELDPGNHAAWGNLGNTFVAAGEWETAGFLYERAAALSSDKSWGAQNLLNLGHHQCEAGDAAGALKVFRKALALDPASGLAHLDIARAQAALGDKDQALENVRKGIELLDQLDGPRAEAGRMMGELLVQKIEAGDRFEAKLPFYVQRLPKPLLKQPDKAKAAALVVGKEIEHTVRVAERLQVSLRAPETWPLLCGEPQPKQAPLTLEFHSPIAGRFQLLLSLQEDAPVPTDLRGAVEKAGRNALAGAVETRLELRELGLKTAPGFYFTLQDKELVGKALAEGEYPFMTQGMMVVGNQLCVFTALCTEKGDKQLGPMLAVLRSVVVRSSGP
jgi:tetratricopeptide (TPR) repeat protein